VTAGTNFKVQWQGPGNDYDHIGIATPGSEKDAFTGRFYVHSGPVSVRAPLEVVEYELRYRTGGSHTILATTKVQVTPAKEEPGSLRVTAGTPTAGGSAGSTSNAVEVILDASGSMLQRIGSERRIDIAKRTLESLVYGFAFDGFAFDGLGRSGTMVSPLASIATRAAIFFSRPAGVFMLFVRKVRAKRF